MTILKKILCLIFAAFAVVYLTLASFAYFFSDQMIFPAPQAHYSDTKDIIKITAADGIEISAIYLPNKKAQYTILFSHGNKEDLGSKMPFLKQLQAHGFAVFAYDYHGYGTSDGEPSEENCYQDINSAYDYLINKLNVPPTKIIDFGYSIGSGPAVELAVTKPVAGLILETPFVSIYRVMTHYPLLPFAKFNNIKKIPKLTVPLLVIHGTKDRTVPFWHGVTLYNKAPQPKMHLWVENATHTNVSEIAQKNYWETIYNFTKLLNQAKK